MPDLDTLTQDILAGQRQAIARAITLLERQEPEGRALLEKLQPHVGRAHVIGITGPPGSGKSTLVEALARAYRQQGLMVGIIAVDPSSPLTGGALLGDRIRMARLSGDRGVFIRSMANRGQLGGLAQATRGAVHVLDAAGFDKVLIETVGAGQDEVDVARVADTCLVVQVPNAGDDIQAIKAGQLEIADLLVVNKADQEGAARAALILRSMVEMGPAVGWPVPVLETIATTGLGVDALVAQIEAHRAYASQHGSDAQPRWQEEALLDRVVEVFLQRLHQRIPDAMMADLRARVSGKRLTFDQAVRELLDQYDNESTGGC